MGYIRTFPGRPGEINVLEKYSVMNRSLLAAVTALTLAGAACSTQSTFTYTCYDVPAEIAEVRGDTTVLETGVRYIETFAGTGAEAVTCSEVTVRYRGAFLDGSEFDSGTFEFVPGAGHVIPGFEQGALGLRVEGVRQVIVPPEQGYGDQPYPSADNEVIPANSTLVFDIEIIQVIE